MTEGEEKPVDKVDVEFVRRVISFTVRILKSSGQDNDELEQAFKYLFTEDVPENIKSAIPVAVDELLAETENVGVREKLNILRDIIQQEKN